MLFKILHPLRRAGGICHIGFIQQHDFGLIADDTFQHRVAAADGNAGIDKLRDNIHKL